MGLELPDGEVKKIKPGAGIDDLIDQHWKQIVRVIGTTDGKYIYPTDILPLEE